MDGLAGDPEGIVLAGGGTALVIGAAALGTAWETAATGTSSTVCAVDVRGEYI